MEKRYYTNGSMEYIGKLKTNIKNKIQSKKKEDTTKRVISDTTRIRRVESKIDQETGIVEQLVQQTSANEEKITKVEQNVDTIKQKVEQVIDCKRSVNGISQIIVTDAIEQGIIYLDISGIKQYQNKLYPKQGRYPQLNLYPNGEVVW